MYNRSRWIIFGFVCFFIAYCLYFGTRSTPDERKSSVSTNQPSVSNSDPVEQSKWVNAVTNLYDGVTVYARWKPGDEPEPYFQVTEASMRSDDGRRIMEVIYEGTDRPQVIDRDKLIMSEMGRSGQLLVLRSDLPK